MTKYSKRVSLAIITIVYIFAFIVGFLLFKLVSATMDPLLSFLAADAASTVVVWLFGLLYKNASMYDPYWSVAPIALIVSFVFFAPKFSVISIIYLVVFLFWGVRLTFNFIKGWDGMKQQDWRYTMLREKNPGLWFLTNFFGINMMPTVLVFAGMVPAYYSIMSGSGVNLATVLGIAICIAAVMLEIISDAQMHTFREDSLSRGKNMQSGLWQYSRHPNYLGEVLFWWGVWIMQVSVLNNLWTILAPLAITLLFVFISIPMMEKRLMESKQGYEEYKKATSMLMLLPKRH